LPKNRAAKGKGTTMAIVSFPSDLQFPATLTCAICAQPIAPAIATAGQLDADNRQAFACNSHFGEANKYILGWIDFAAAQHLLLLSRGIGPNNLNGGTYGRTI
jgi:hypothetical protein